jgi:hypothetical protein
MTIVGQVRELRLFGDARVVVLALGEPRSTTHDGYEEALCLTLAISGDVRGVTRHGELAPWDTKWFDDAPAGMTERIA